MAVMKSTNSGMEITHRATELKKNRASPVPTFDANAREQAMKRD